MSGRPTKCAGPRNSTSREIAGKNQCVEQMTYHKTMEALIVTAEELESLAKSLSQTVNNWRTEIDIVRNLADQKKQMQMIFEEFGWKGSSYVKKINGKNYVVFKGYAGLREVFQSTKYLADNARVVSYGLGKQAGNVMKGNFVSILYVTAFNVIELSLIHI